MPFSASRFLSKRTSSRIMGSILQSFRDFFANIPSAPFPTKLQRTPWPMKNVSYASEYERKYFSCVCSGEEWCWYEQATQDGGETWETQKVETMDAQTYKRTFRTFWQLQRQYREGKFRPQRECRVILCPCVPDAFHRVPELVTVFSFTPEGINELQ